MVCPSERHEAVTVAAYTARHHDDHIVLARVTIGGCELTLVACPSSASCGSFTSVTTFTGSQGGSSKLCCKDNTNSMTNTGESSPLWSVAGCAARSLRLCAIDSAYPKRRGNRPARPVLFRLQLPWFSGRHPRQPLPRALHGMPRVMLDRHSCRRRKALHPLVHNLQVSGLLQLASSKLHSPRGCCATLASRDELSKHQSSQGYQGYSNPWLASHGSHSKHRAHSATPEYAEHAAILVQRARKSPMVPKESGWDTPNA